MHVSTQSPIHCVFFSTEKNKPFDVEDQRDLFWKQNILRRILKMVWTKACYLFSLLRPLRCAKQLRVLNFNECSVHTYCHISHIFFGLNKLLLQKYQITLKFMVIIVQKSVNALHLSSRIQLWNVNSIEFFLFKHFSNVSKMEKRNCRWHRKCKLKSAVPAYSTEMFSSKIITFGSLFLCDVIHLVPCPIHSRALKYILPFTNDWQS